MNVFQAAIAFLLYLAATALIAGAYVTAYSVLAVRQATVKTRMQTSVTAHLAGVVVLIVAGWTNAAAGDYAPSLVAYATSWSSIGVKLAALVTGVAIVITGLVEVCLRHTDRVMADQPTRLIAVPPYGSVPVIGAH